MPFAHPISAVLGLVLSDRGLPRVQVGLGEQVLVPFGNQKSPVQANTSPMVGLNSAIVHVLDHLGFDALGWCRCEEYGLGRVCCVAELRGELPPLQVRGGWARSSE